MSRPMKCMLVLSSLALLVAACNRDQATQGDRAASAGPGTGGGGGGIGGVAAQGGYTTAEVRIGDAERVAAPGPSNRAPAIVRGIDVASGADQATDRNSLPVDATAPMVVRTGTATIKVDSLPRAIAQLRLAAQRLGGYVGTTSIQVGTEESRSATVELKVPALRWNDLLNGIAPIGTLEHQEESAQDVGEEFVDVTARVANAQRLEARLIDLLATRTGKLSDALEVEQQLARVREEIERYQGRLRYLRSRSAISTMTVALHEPLPLVGSHPGDNPIRDAFATAWSTFVGFVAFLIASLGVVIPVGLLVALAWFIWNRARRRTAVA